MPWTLSHPLAVLPLKKFCKRTPLLFAAFVCGSMSPDIGYYTNQFPLATKAHHFSGSFLYCVPYAAVMLFCIGMLRKGFCELLPEPHKKLLLEKCVSVSFSLKSIGLWLLALWFGALTHIVWDSFTHFTGYGVHLCPCLKNNIVNGFAVYQGLQYLSTIVGAVVMSYVYVQWIKNSGETFFQQPNKKRIVFWTLVMAASFSYAMYRTMPMIKHCSGLYAFRIFAFRFAVHSSEAMCLLVAAASFVMMVKDKKHGAS